MTTGYHRKMDKAGVTAMRKRTTREKVALRAGRTKSLLDAALELWRIKKGIDKW